MNRIDRLIRGIPKDAKGIEIGPYFQPLTPRSKGYNCLSIDVFDTDTLRKKAEEDSAVPRHMIANIEPVDIIGSVSDLEKLIEERRELGTFDYIISSHNFEHIPDPIKFLNGCERVLKESGSLIMAIPDKRACFDYFSPTSTLDEMLGAHVESRWRPTPEQIFRRTLHNSFYYRNGVRYVGWSLDDDPAGIKPIFRLKQALNLWKILQRSPDDEYRDVHCWVFTPSSFELIMRDMIYLGLVQFDIEEISGNYGLEFYVRLSYTRDNARRKEFRKNYPTYRTELLFRCLDEASVNVPSVWKTRMDRGEFLDNHTLTEDILSIFPHAAPPAGSTILGISQDGGRSVDCIFHFLENVQRVPAKALVFCQSDADLTEANTRLRKLGDSVQLHRHDSVQVLPITEPANFGYALYGPISREELFCVGSQLKAALREKGYLVFGLSGLKQGEIPGSAGVPAHDAQTLETVNRVFRELLGFPYLTTRIIGSKLWICARRAPLSLPDWFDPETYLQRNPDVIAHPDGPGAHWLAHGHQESRIWW